jgi:hypothetical protein
VLGLAGIRREQLALLRCATLDCLKLSEHTIVLDTPCLFSSAHETALYSYCGCRQQQTSASALYTAVIPRAKARSECTLPGAVDLEILRKSGCAQAGAGLISFQTTHRLQVRILRSNPRSTQRLIRNSVAIVTKFN